jgi:WD40 repeat protein
MAQRIDIALPDAEALQYSETLLDRRNRGQVPESARLSSVWKTVQKFIRREDMHYDRVPLMAVHPGKGVICVTRGACLLLYFIKSSQWSEQQSFHNEAEHGVMLSMKWSFSTNTLFVGTSKGICVWFFEDIEPSEGKLPWMRFLCHPKGLSVDDLMPCPTGSQVAAVSKRERQLMIWDYVVGSSTPLYCFNGSLGHSVAWSPDGFHISATTA